jgi:hypothetical protein
MEAMPRHDPIPRAAEAPYEGADVAWTRYKRLMRWMALVAAVASALALVYLSASGEPLRLHMVIATIAGVGFSVLVGTGLMGLVFLSNRTGHDADAAGGGRE